MRSSRILTWSLATAGASSSARLRSTKRFHLTTVHKSTAPVIAVNVKSSSPTAKRFGRRLSANGSVQFASAPLKECSSYFSYCIQSLFPFDVYPTALHQQCLLSMRPSAFCIETHTLANRGSMTARSFSSSAFGTKSAQDESDPSGLIQDVKASSDKSTTKKVVASNSEGTCVPEATVENVKSPALSKEEKLRQELTRLILERKVVLFMKGNPDAPQCGFSKKAVQYLCDLGCLDFTFVDVLRSEAVRQAVKSYTNWPTIPQLFVGGEFVGGSDIMKELFASGELKKMLLEKGVLLQPSPPTKTARK